MWETPLSWHAVYVLALIRVLIIGCRSIVILLSKSQLAVVPTSTCAFYVITLLICDEVIRFGFLGLVIHFANPLRVFKVTAFARWISLTSYIASKQFPDLCSFICDRRVPCHELGLDKLCIACQPSQSRSPRISSKMHKEPQTSYV